MSAVRHLFWDFDGTLYNSYPLMNEDMMLALQEHGYGDLFTWDELMDLMKISIGKAMKVFVERTQQDPQPIKESYRARQHARIYFEPYAGLKECLEKLHANGFRHYLYTHRNQVAIDQLERDGLWHLFSDAVTSDDHFPLKPAPDALLALMQRHGLQPEECAMVGDRDIDVIAGHNAGMSGVLFDPDQYYLHFKDAELFVTTLSELSDKLLAD